MGLFGDVASKLADFKGVRRTENAFTGARLSGAGHFLGGVTGAGYIAGKAKYAGSGIEPQVFNKAPGIKQAKAMSYDMKRNPTMGVSGSLTLALGDIENNIGKY